MVPPNRPNTVRLLSGLALVALIALDIAYHADIAPLIGAHPFAGIILGAFAAFALAVALQFLIHGKFSIDDPNLKWLAIVLFVALLLRYSLLSFFQLTPNVLLFIAIVLCATGVWRARSGDGAGEIRKRDLALTMRVLSLGLIFGLYLVLAATGYAPKEDAFTVERTAMGWGLAYFGVFFIVGFLFAYPRTLQGDPEKKSPYEQRVNTNLEQISDWLTKIIVGLGLVELNTIPTKLAEASTWMAQSFASPPTAAPTSAVASFCTAFIIFFSVLGFLGGHLSTRMFLSPAFYRGDQREVVSVQTQTAAEDDTAKRYLAFIKDKANGDKVDAWLTLQGKPKLKASDIVAGAEFAELRKQALDELSKS